MCAWVRVVGLHESLQPTRLRQCRKTSPLRLRLRPSCWLSLRIWCTLAVAGIAYGIARSPCLYEAFSARCPFSFSCEIHLDRVWWNLPDLFRASSFECWDKHMLPFMSASASRSQGRSTPKQTTLRAIAESLATEAEPWESQEHKRLYYVSN